MSDTTLNAFVAQGTDAERIAFTPSPPTPAALPDSGYYFFVNDTTPKKLYAWDSAGSAWVLISSGGSGTIPVTAQGDTLYASAANTLSALAKDTNATRYLSNTGASNNPAWSLVNLANGVTGDLPFANLAQGTALSVLGVTGNATADNASIVAASDFQVMRRSGTAVAFGSVNLASSNAVTGVLPVANGGTGSSSGAAILVSVTDLTNAQIKALPTTPVQLLAAPGATIRYKIIGATLLVSVTTTTYTNVNTTYAAIQIETAAGSWVATGIVNDTSGSLADLTGLLCGATHDAIVDLLPGNTSPGGIAGTTGWQSYAVTQSTSNFANNAIQISIDNNGSGNLTAGDAGAHARVTLYYTTEDLS